MEGERIRSYYEEGEIRYYCKKCRRRIGETYCYHCRTNWDSAQVKKAIGVKDGHGKTYLLHGCECDNTHKQNNTVCRFCYAFGRRRYKDAETIQTI